SGYARWWQNFIPEGYGLYQQWRNGKNFGQSQVLPSPGGGSGGDEEDAVSRPGLGEDWTRAAEAAEESELTMGLF
ncbi:hypothetical protein THAOC_37616, partial [Thalassiosira oceanica]